MFVSWIGHTTPPLCEGESKLAPYFLYSFDSVPFKFMCLVVQSQVISRLFDSVVLLLPRLVFPPRKVFPPWRKDPAPFK
jgi:hypothetical protein